MTNHIVVKKVFGIFQLPNEENRNTKVEPLEIINLHLKKVKMRGKMTLQVELLKSQKTQVLLRAKKEPPFLMPMRIN